jgi:hypothetical protein
MRKTIEIEGVGRNIRGLQTGRKLEAQENIATPQNHIRLDDMKVI